jgi:hypothetical protein
MKLHLDPVAGLDLDLLTYDVPLKAIAACQPAHDLIRTNPLPFQIGLLRP